MSHPHEATHTHPYHLVNPSPWPAFASLALFFGTLGAAMSFHQKPGGVLVLLLGLFMVLYCMYTWWRDVIHEARDGHSHTREVSRGLRAGMALFITSEVLFFAAFFWAYFSSSMLPRAPLADVWGIAPGIWPPKGIHVFDPFKLPFLNTLILLLSGTTVTWAHHAILEGNRKDAVQALWFTVILGMLFTLCQAYEYTHAAFGFKDGVYASTFFMATGFHGFHVIVGTIFLAVCLARATQGDFTPRQHLGFEFAAWYWHFVDVVWLFLFIAIYNDLGNVLLPTLEAVFTGANLLMATVVAGIFGTVFLVYFMKKGGMSLKVHH